MQNRSIYTDSARQNFSVWLRQKESQFLRIARDAEGDEAALPQLESDWTRGLAIAAIAGGQPQEWRLEIAIFSPTEEWRDVGEDCALLRRAIDLVGNSLNSVVIDNGLTQLVGRIFAPGWMMVVFEHPEEKISIIVSSIPNDCGIENFDPAQLYCEMLEGGIEALENPDGRIAPDQ
jgi:hypothetical protein